MCQMIKNRKCRIFYIWEKDSNKTLVCILYFCSSNLYRVIIDVVIPALNEAASIGKVIDDLPKQYLRHIIVANNGSTDETQAIAEAKGAIVVNQSIKGYGIACLTALNFVKNQNQLPDIIVFLDGDYSDHPEELPMLTAPIETGNYDLVLGSRVLGQSQKGALLWQQRVGNAIATTLIRWFYGYRFTDLGPFRAIRYTSLMQLNMADQNYGWTAEMQVKAAKKKLSCLEVPVTYRKRIGKSKVSGTILGSIMAGYKILFIVFKWIFK